jgi:hypothetical protein
MEKIYIQVKNPEKADLLVQFLKALDFVESVSRADIPVTESSQSTDLSAEFFALAGLWADRKITLETLRQKAWPKRS